VTFICDGVPGVIDLQPVACDCAELHPGTPLAGQGFTLGISEAVGAVESISGPFDLPSVVEPGFVRLAWRRPPAAPGPAAKCFDLL